MSQNAQTYLGNFAYAHDGLCLRLCLMTQISLTPEELSDLIGLVYDSAFEDVQWQSLLTRLTEFFPGVGGIAFGVDQDIVHPAFARAGVSARFLTSLWRSISRVIQI